MARNPRVAPSEDMSVPRELRPPDSCPTCGGELLWSRVRYVPEERRGDEIVPAHWVGSGPVCGRRLESGREPARAPFLGPTGPALRLA